MSTTTLEDLRKKEAKLKERERELTSAWHAAPGSPVGAKTRTEVYNQLQEVTGELVRLYPQIAGAKERRKKDRLEELVHSTEYRQAVVAGLESLAASLGPWVGLLELTAQARHQGVSVPLPPPAISSLYVDSKAWIGTLLSQRFLAPSDLPAPLRPLVESRND